MTIANLQRAAWAKQALLAYSSAKDGSHLLYDEEEAVFGDMLADLMHYAQSCGFDFSEHIERAKGHYDAESAEEAQP
jgi:hypothetical protein